MIPKRDKQTDIASEIAQGKHFQKRLRQCAEEAASRFIRGETLNFAVADITKRENFNQLQIQRLVEETNTIAFNKKYDERRKESDRRISFGLAELSGVLEELGSEAPPAMENPNWVKGKLGEGNMAKSASVQIHSPNSSTDASRERLKARQENEKRQALEKEARELNREIESGIFKVAQAIVHSERSFKNGNQVFNTMLSNVAFDDFMADGIMKKAEEITDHMVATKRFHSGFELNLEVRPQEKVASTIFGTHSLLKSANELDLVKEPKIAPIQDIGDYQQLINLAKEIQNKQQASLNAEKELHGGAPVVK